jgi:hypothetical protein
MHSFTDDFMAQSKLSAGYRYLDGWRERETRAAMVFGRCFENALGAFFRQEDSAAALFKEWGAFRDASFEYKKGDSWGRVVHQGVHLLETFARDDRVRIHSPRKNLQIKVVRTLPGGNDFVAYLDALGNSMASSASLTGRLRPVVIQMTQMGCFR